MSTRTITRIAAILLVLCTTAAMRGAPPAQAGAYNVRSCFADGIAGIWQRSRTTDLADAYIECPEGTNNNHGLYARNVLSSTPAPGFGSAQLFVNTPPGTYIDDVQFEANIAKSRNWQAGLYDVQNGRWLWCGSACGTSFIWSSQHIGGFATTSLAILIICGASQCASDGELVAFLSLRNVTLRLQDVWNPSVAIVGGSLASGGWKRGVQTVEVAGSDNAGVAALTSSIDGESRDVQIIGCDDHVLVPCPGTTTRTLKVDVRGLSDGQHTLEVRSVDAGGNATAERRGVFVDNTPPGPVLNLSSTAGDWQAANDFSLTWENPTQQAGAPLAGISYQFCPEDLKSAISCTAPKFVPTLRAASVVGISVPSPGAWRLRLWLVDEAENQNDQTARETPLRWDPEAPLVRLLSRDDNDPARISVDASDAVSGIASVEIELRRDGDSTWHSLRVDRTVAGFAGVVDDEAFPRGTYAVRARARDFAGNERSTETTPTSITLPVRLETNLAVGRSKFVRAGSKGRRQVLIRKPESRYGEAIKLTGRLTSRGRNPLVDRDVEISQRIRLPRAAWSPIAVVRTDNYGRFTFKAPPGPNRFIRFRYPGTPTVQGETSVVELRIRAASSLHVNRHHVANGEEVVFRGRVKGQPIPSTGKLLQLQVFSRGSWLTFATPRASSRGWWSQRYRFTATRGATRYRFRVRLPREAGYPFYPGSSRTVRVMVTGV